MNSARVGPGNCAVMMICGKRYRIESDRTFSGRCVETASRETDLELPADFEQTLDTLADGWVGREQPVHEAGFHGVGDPHVRHRRRLALERTLVFAELVERAGETLGITRGHGPGRVGKEFALAGYSGLDECGDQGRNDQSDEAKHERHHGQRTARAAVPASATSVERHSEEDVGDKPDGNNEPEDDGAHADVVVLDVPHLVRHYPFEFGVGHDVEQTRCRGNDRVFGVAARRKGIRCWIGHDVHLGHRHAVGNRQVFDNPPQPRVVFHLNLDGSRRRDRDRGRVIKLEPCVEPRTNHGRDGDSPRAATKEVSDEPTQPGDEGEKDHNNDNGVPLIRGNRTVHRRLELNLWRFGDCVRVVDLEEVTFAERELGGPEVVGEHEDHRVEIAHATVVEAS